MFGTLLVGVHQLCWFIWEGVVTPGDGAEDPYQWSEIGKAGHMAKGSSVFAAELLIAEVAGEYRRTVGPAWLRPDGGYV